MQTNLSKETKLELIAELTGCLPALRRSLDISQEDIAWIVGISRQTYCALEQGKRPMSWNTFLSLLLFFLSNDASCELLKTCYADFLFRVHQALRYERKDSPVPDPGGVARYTG